MGSTKRPAHDDSDPEIIRALRVLADAVESGPSELDTETLIGLARDADLMRGTAPLIMGRLLAELNGRGHSWPELARLTGISQSQAFRSAEPYVRNRGQGRRTDLTPDTP